MDYASNRLISRYFPSLDMENCARHFTWISASVKWLNHSTWNAISSAWLAFITNFIERSSHCQRSIIADTKSRIPCAKMNRLFDELDDNQKTSEFALFWMILSRFTTKMAYAIEVFSRGNQFSTVDIKSISFEVWLFWQVITCSFGLKSRQFQFIGGLDLFRLHRNKILSSEMQNVLSLITWICGLLELYIPELSAQIKQ